MATLDQVESIANACLEANDEIKKYGTPDMQNLMRVLLHRIGQELARQLSEEHKVIHGPWVERPTQGIQKR